MATLKRPPKKAYEWTAPRKNSQPSLEQSLCSSSVKSCWMNREVAPGGRGALVFTGHPGWRCGNHITEKWHKCRANHYEISVGSSLCWFSKWGPHTCGPVPPGKVSDAQTHRPHWRHPESGDSEMGPAVSVSYGAVWAGTSAGRGPWAHGPQTEELQIQAGATGPWTTDWGVTDSALGSVMGPSIVCSRFQCYPDHTGVRLLTCYTELRHECTENALLFTVTHIQIAMHLLFNFILQLNLGTQEKCCSSIHFYWCIFIKKTEPHCKGCVL